MRKYKVKDRSERSPQRDNNTDYTMYGHPDKTGKSQSKGESKSLIREEREKEEEASERLI